MAIKLKRGAAARIKRIRLLVLDVDGVMTDGRIIYTDSGEEIKAFDVRDGHGLRLFMRAGLEVAIVTSRQSNVVLHRAKNLGITDVYQGRLEKIEAFEEILKAKGLKPEEAACMGDDLVDLPMLRRTGFATAVPEAVPEVKKAAHYVAKCGGGRGAVREVVELILKVQGKWEEVIKRYYL